MILENGPSHHETWSIWCHVRIHIDFTSTLHCVGPPSVMWSALGAGSAFSTNESAWSAMVTGLQSRMWSGLEEFRRKNPNLPNPLILPLPSLQLTDTSAPAGTYLVSYRPTWAASPPTSYLPAHDLPTYQSSRQGPPCPLSCWSR